MQNLPPGFEERLKQIIPAHFLGGISFKAKPYSSFRINTLKAALPEIHELLKEKGIPFEEVSWSPEAFMVPAGSREAVLNLGLEGKVYSQSLESMAAVLALDPKPGEHILDLCAAPGSKTTQIAALMNNEGHLSANEFVRTRFFKLKSVLEIMGAKANVFSLDGRRFQAKDGLYDKVLLDAPCSSEGRFNSAEPKSFGYWSRHKIKEMAHKQKGLLANAGRLVREGGVILYSTCTFAPEENEEVLEWFLKRNEGFSIEPINLNIPRYPTLTAWGKRNFPPEIQNAFRILPTDRNGGFFMARLRKL